jgi:hypothetical protein
MQILHDYRDVVGRTTQEPKSRSKNLPASSSTSVPDSSLPPPAYRLHTSMRAPVTRREMLDGLPKNEKAKC